MKRILFLGIASLISLVDRAKWSTLLNSTKAILVAKSPGIEYLIMALYVLYDGEPGLGIKMDGVGSETMPFNDPRHINKVALYLNDLHRAFKG